MGKISRIGGGNVMVWGASVTQSTAPNYTRPEGKKQSARVQSAEDWPEQSSDLGAIEH